MVTWWERTSRFPTVSSPPPAGSSHDDSLPDDEFLRPRLMAPPPAVAPSSARRHPLVAPLRDVAAASTAAAKVESMRKPDGTQSARRSCTPRVDLGRSYTQWGRIFTARPSVSLPPTPQPMRVASRPSRRASGRVIEERRLVTPRRTAGQDLTSSCNPDASQAAWAWAQDPPGPNEDWPELCAVGGAGSEPADQPHTVYI